MVRRHLTPPPSSTNVEKLLSYGGLVATDHRSSISGEKLDQILFLRQNYKDSQCVIKTLPKAQQTRGLSSFCQSKFLRSYHKFKHKSASTKNLNQTSASPQNLKFKILTKPSFRISTKIQLHNLYKTSAAK